MFESLDTSTKVFLIFLLQLAIGLAVFSMIYLFTGQTLEALISAVFFQLSAAAFFVWEITRD